jgi:hypothetical protein
MSSRAARENTPAAKCTKLNSAAVTPLTITPHDPALALAISRIQTEGATAAAAKAEANAEEEMDDTDEATPAGPEPAPLLCSQELLPTTFTSFLVIIAKKITTMLMMKRAKLRVISKLEQRETVPNSIGFKSELLPNRTAELHDGRRPNGN